MWVCVGRGAGSQWTHWASQISEKKAAALQILASTQEFWLSRHIYLAVLADGGKELRGTKRERLHFEQSVNLGA